MELLAIWCVLILSAYDCVFANIEIVEEPRHQIQENIADRLANIEANLEAVLKKNVELEQRIDVLEDENRRLKELVKKEDPNRSDAESRQDMQDTETEYGIHQTPSNGQTKRNVKVTRILLKGDVSVGFTAGIGQRHLSNLQRGQTIIYESIITNVGRAYSNATGVFTAPMNGVFVFNYDTMVEPGTYEYVELVKNGIRVVDSLASAVGETHYVTTSRTVVLQLDEGNTVWTRVFDDVGHGSGIVHGWHYSTFSGWLLAVI